MGLVASCGSSMVIETQVESDADFSDYKTWNWLPDIEPPTDPRVADPMVQQRIRTAIERQFAEQGFEKTTTSPDFYVSYHAALQDHLSQTMVDDRYDNASYAEYATNWEHDYTHAWLEGSLVIDILDAESIELVWRGSAQAELTENATDDERDKRVKEAVAKMLEKFPPNK